MSDLLLQARNLVAGYVSGINILKGCSLDLHEGETVGIIGPNGAGKSTLMKTLFGVLAPREGEILLDGSSIARVMPHNLVRIGLAYVPQTKNVFGRLSIQENLEMGTYQAQKKFQERLEVVCELFPMLSQDRQQRASNLSGGQRQMVAIARALMMEPRVLLLDEPSAGLSPAFQDEVFEQITRLADIGVSTIIVEQNAQRCLEICDRGYVLDQGVNAYTGNGNDLLNDPKVIELYLGTLGTR